MFGGKLPFGVNKDGTLCSERETVREGLGSDTRSRWGWFLPAPAFQLGRGVSPELLLATLTLLPAGSGGLPPQQARACVCLLILESPVIPSTGKEVLFSTPKELPEREGMPDGVSKAIIKALNKNSDECVHITPGFPEQCHILVITKSSAHKAGRCFSLSGRLRLCWQWGCGAGTGVVLFWRALALRTSQFRPTRSRLRTLQSPADPFVQHSPQSKIKEEAPENSVRVPLPVYTSHRFVKALADAGGHARGTEQDAHQVSGLL